MEITIIEGLPTLKFDLILTLALAAVFLFLGYAAQKHISLFARYSIPAPAIGGLAFAFIVFILKFRGIAAITLDTTLRAPLQTIFFTTIGLSATLSLLRKGGWRMAFFWLIASVGAVIQNIVGIGTARVIGAPEPLGIICGALTLSGGPATGLAFADTFERIGIPGAGALIIASATFGIFISSIVGNPVAIALIKRFRLAKARPVKTIATNITETQIEVTEGVAVEEDRRRDFPATGKTAKEPLTSFVLLRNLAIILIVMGIGALVGLGLTRALKLISDNATLPGYVGAMIVAACLRNLDDQFNFLKINMRAVEAVGVVALALFLLIALMDLKLWQLAGLAAPMLIILPFQVVAMIVYACLVTFVLMGRDYEAAVTASGHIGFGLGITPNAVANMEALTERYGAAPRSFLIVPIVGAFFIDFSNTLIITASINLLR